MTKNESIIRAFAGQFSPPLECVKTQMIDLRPTPGAWSASMWDNKHQIGITCVVYRGEMRAFIECVGKDEVAATAAGKLLAKVLGRTNEGKEHGGRDQKRTPRGKR